MEAIMFKTTEIWEYRIRYVFVCEREVDRKGKEKERGQEGRNEEKGGRTERKWRGENGGEKEQIKNTEADGDRNMRFCSTIILKRQSIVNILIKNKIAYFVQDKITLFYHQFMHYKGLNNTYEKTCAYEDTFEQAAVFFYLQMSHHYVSLILLMKLNIWLFSRHMDLISLRNIKYFLHGTLDSVKYQSPSLMHSLLFKISISSLRNTISIYFDHIHHTKFFSDLPLTPYSSSLYSLPFLEAQQVQFVLPIYSSVCGHPLEYG